MPRIAVVIDPWAHPFNGTVVSARRFVAALERRGYAFRLLAIAGSFAAGDSRGVAFPRLSIPGVNGIIDRMRAPLARPQRARLRAALEGCDLLHVQFPFFLGHAAIREAHRLGLPVVCSFHVQPENILNNIGINSALVSRWLYRLLVRAFYNRADEVIAPSAFAANLLRDNGVTRPITVVSNGVPAVFFQPHGEPAGDRLRVLSVGRLASEKRHDVLLQAVASSAFRSRIELTIAGVGPREASLKALARTLGVRASIGRVDDAGLLQAYADADLVVHTGTAELEGMSVLEAMAAGNTVLVSDAAESACAHFITVPRCRFRSGDAVSLRAALDDWLADARGRRVMGDSNRFQAHALAHEKSVDRLVDLYTRMLGGAHPAAQVGGA